MFKVMLRCSHSRRIIRTISCGWNRAAMSSPNQACCWPESDADQRERRGTVRLRLLPGMNSLIWPALYGAYHEIVNLSRMGQTPTERYTVVGPNCETGDRLGLDRLLPRCESGENILLDCQKGLRLRHELTLQPERAGKRDCHLVIW